MLFHLLHLHYDMKKHWACLKRNASVNQFNPSFPQRTIYEKQEKCVVRISSQISSLADLKQDSKKRLGKDGAETWAYETIPYVILVNHGNSNFNIILHPKANSSKCAHFFFTAFFKLGNSHFEQGSYYKERNYSDPWALFNCRSWYLFIWKHLIDEGKLFLCFPAC